MLRGDAAVDGHPVERVDGCPVERVDVRLRVGAIDKTLRVTGDRRWRGQEGPASPAPFRRMPLRYEHALADDVQTPASLTRKTL